MLRALLAKQAARNLTRRLKAESCKFDSFQECGDGSLTSLNNNNEYCFNSNDGFIFLNPVTITDQNGKESSGVYMAVGGCYKIKSTQPEKFQQTYFPVQSSYEVNENELLKQLKEDKSMPWIAGENERFRGRTFGDAKVISGSAHKLRPDTIPLAKPQNTKQSDTNSFPNIISPMQPPKYPNLPIPEE